MFENITYASTSSVRGKYGSFSLQKTASHCMNWETRTNMEQRENWRECKCLAVCVFICNAESSLSYVLAGFVQFINRNQTQNRAHTWISKMQKSETPYSTYTKPFSFLFIARLKWTEQSDCNYNTDSAKKKHTTFFFYLFMLLLFCFELFFLSLFRLYLLDADTALSFVAHNKPLSHTHTHNIIGKERIRRK